MYSSLSLSLCLSLSIYIHILSEADAVHRREHPGRPAACSADERGLPQLRPISLLTLSLLRLLDSNFPGNPLWR